MAFHIFQPVHDYKKQGVPEKELKKWIQQCGWESILNRRGTTWRKLDDEVKSTIDQASAIQIMLENPSSIKRPVLDVDGQYEIGFKAEVYEKLFK